MVASVLNMSRRQVYFKTYLLFSLYAADLKPFVIVCNGKYESINNIVWMSTWVSNLTKNYVESVVNETPKPGSLFVFFPQLFFNIILSMTATANSFAFQLELIASQNS